VALGGRAIHNTLLLALTFGWRELQNSRISPSLLGEAVDIPHEEI